MLTAGSMVVRRDKRLKLQGTNLIISDLEPEDTGEYDCEIEADTDRPISVTHKLDILIPPKVIKDQGPSRLLLTLLLFQIYSEPADGNVVVKKGSSVSIRCVASGNPAPRVTWSKVNQVETLGSGEVLELTQVTRHHEGQYQCSASNGVGDTVASHINLRVLREYLLFLVHLSMRCKNDLLKNILYCKRSRNVKNVIVQINLRLWRRRRQCSQEWVTRRSWSASSTVHPRRSWSGTEAR